MYIHIRCDALHKVQDRLTSFFIKILMRIYRPTMPQHATVIDDFAARLSHNAEHYQLATMWLLQFIFKAHNGVISLYSLAMTHKMLISLLSYVLKIDWLSTSKTNLNWGTSYHIADQEEYRDTCIQEYKNEHKKHQEWVKIKRKFLPVLRWFVLMGQK